MSEEILKIKMTLYIEKYRFDLSIYECSLMNFHENFMISFFFFALSLKKKTPLNFKSQGQIKPIRVTICWYLTEAIKPALSSSLIHQAKSFVRKKYFVA